MILTEELLSTMVTVLLGYFVDIWFDLSGNNSKDREDVLSVSSCSSDCSCCDSAQQEAKESGLKSFVELIQIFSNFNAETRVTESIRIRFML